MLRLGFFFSALALYSESTEGWGVQEEGCWGSELKASSLSEGLKAHRGALPPPAPLNENMD